MRGTQLKNHLLFGPQVQRLQMTTLTEIPDMQTMSVLTAQQQLGIHTVLDHVRRAPLAGDCDVVTQMPREVITEVLRTTFDLPSAHGLKVVVIEGKDSARAIAAGRAQST